MTAWRLWALFIAIADPAVADAVFFLFVCFHLACGWLWGKWRRSLGQTKESHKDGEERFLTWTADKGLDAHEIQRVHYTGCRAIVDNLSQVL